MLPSLISLIPAAAVVSVIVMIAAAGIFISAVPAAVFSPVMHDDDADDDYRHKRCQDTAGDGDDEKCGIVVI